MDSKRDKNIIKVPLELRSRCYALALMRLDQYATGRANNSLAVSSHGAEHSLDIQKQGLFAELGMCLWSGLDAVAHLDRARRETADNGTDIVVGQGYRIDVKSTGWYGQWLLWPYRKRQLYASKVFDALVLVKVDWDASLCLIGGWITKSEFAKQHKAAVEGNPWHFTIGTMILHEKFLTPMECFPYRMIVA
jgi:hypothetical protein